MSIFLAQVIEDLQTLISFRNGCIKQAAEHCHPATKAQEEGLEVKFKAWGERDGSTGWERDFPCETGVQSEPT